MQHCLTWETHGINGGESTNNSTIQSHKAYTSIVTSLISTLRVTDNKELTRIRDGHQSFPDVLFVPDHCGAKESKHMWEHILNKLGIPTWGFQHSTSIASTIAKASLELLNESALKDRGVNHITIFTVGTDKGGEQQATTILVEASVLYDPTTWVVRFLA